jgi:hypothetical protein
LQIVETTHPSSVGKGGWESPRTGTASWHRKESRSIISCLLTRFQKKRMREDFDVAWKVAQKFAVRLDRDFFIG